MRIGLFFYRICFNFYTLIFAEGAMIGVVITGLVFFDHFAYGLFPFRVIVPGFHELRKAYAGINAKQVFHFAGIDFGLILIQAEDFVKKGFE